MTRVEVTEESNGAVMTVDESLIPGVPVMCNVLPISDRCHMVTWEPARRIPKEDWKLERETGTWARPGTR